MFALSACAFGAATLQLVPTRSSVARAQDDQPEAYRIQITFSGLVTFVPRDVQPTNDGQTAAELWVLLPAANDLDRVKQAEGCMRKRGRFRPKGGAHPKHHALLDIPGRFGTNPMDTTEGPSLVLLNPGHSIGVDITLTPSGPRMSGERVHMTGFENVPKVRDEAGVAHACAGCLSDEGPERDEHGEVVPLGARLVFRDGETVYPVNNKDYDWTYSEKLDAQDPVARRLPNTVVVRTKELRGPTTITVSSRGGLGSATYVVDARNGLMESDDEPKVVPLFIQNTGLDELFEGPKLTTPHKRHRVRLEHFKLAYLLAPNTQAGQTPNPRYDYRRFPYPVAVPRACDGTNCGTNGDPFCTPPNQMLPPD